MKIKKFVTYAKKNTDKIDKYEFYIYHKVRDHVITQENLVDLLIVLQRNITFSVPISKELGNGKKITYRLKFSNSFRFMSTL